MNLILSLLNLKTKNIFPTQPRKKKAYKFIQIFKTVMEHR